MNERPKIRTLKVEVSVGERDTYSPKNIVRFAIEENFPSNVDPVAYVRQRIGEELRRIAPMIQAEHSTEANDEIPF